MGIPQLFWATYSNIWPISLESTQCLQFGWIINSENCFSHIKIIRTTLSPSYYNKWEMMEECIKKGEEGWMWRQFYSNQEKYWHVSSARHEFLFSRTDTRTYQPMQVRSQMRRGKEQKGESAPLIYHHSASIWNCSTLSWHRKMVFMQELKMPPQHQVLANTQSF